MYLYLYMYLLCLVTFARFFFFCAHSLKLTNFAQWNYQMGCFELELDNRLRGSPPDYEVRINKSESHQDILQWPTVLIGQFFANFFGILDQKWSLPSIYCDTSNLQKSHRLPPTFADTDRGHLQGHNGSWRRPRPGHMKHPIG